MGFCDNASTSSEQASKFGFSEHTGFHREASVLAFAGTSDELWNPSL